MKKIEKINMKIGTVLIMLALGIIAFVCLNVAARNLNGNYEKTNLAISIQAIPQNTEITSENLSKYFRVENNVNVDMLTEDSVTDLQELVGLYANEDIHDRETIVRSSFSSEKDKKMEYRNPDEISFAVDTCASAVSGTLRKGDYVNVYVTDESLPEAEKVLENVYISDAFDSSGVKIEAGDKTTVATIFNIYIERNEEKLFYEAIDGKQVIAAKIIPDK